MAFIVKKNIHGKDYFYLNENKRVDGKVKTKTLAYLGKTREEAEAKLKTMEEGEEETAKSMLEQQHISIEDLATFCKQKGFVFRSSDLYGGYSGFWDFGPLGVELFNNLKREWWNYFVKRREDMVGMEASVISHPKTWKASGHLDSFSDVMVYDEKKQKYLRSDQIIEDVLGVNADGLSKEAMLELIAKNTHKFSEKGYHLAQELTDFNLMFQTTVGPKQVEGKEDIATAYLRGETAQGMFLDFKLIAQTARKQLPFGIAQIGRCFRNEIAPRDFLFRSREFHIGEFEYFLDPTDIACDKLSAEHKLASFQFLDAETQKEEKDDLRKATIGTLLEEKRLNEWHAYWLAEQLLFFKRIGIGGSFLKVREHTKDELSHYSSATFDIDFVFPFGSKEVAGNANRGTYDLTQHQEASKTSLEIFDETKGKKILPSVIEPTFGMERIFLALLTKAYCKDAQREHVVLSLPPKLAPITAAVFPIVKRSEFEDLSQRIVDDLREEFAVVYDKGGSIGRRYARNDEIGTPYCITIDDDSLTSKDVTLRDRDTTEQRRVPISELASTLRKLLEGAPFSSVGVSTATRKK